MGITANSPEITSRNTRQHWIDLLRGTSILLVIVNHAVLFTEREVGAAPDLAAALNTILAPVRMPLMVFLSGLFLARALQKPPKLYLLGKVRRVLYPFLLWSLGIIIIGGLLKVAAGGTFPYSELVRNFYAPVAHTWFLYYLFIYYVLALILKRFPPLLVAGSLLLICAVTPVIERFFLLMAFFMLGKWAADNAKIFERIMASRVVLAISSAFVVGLALLAFRGVEVRYEAVSAPLVAAGIVVLIRIARAIQGFAWLQPLRVIGRESIVYYLGHWYGALMGVRFAVSLDWDPWLMVASGACGGLLTAMACHAAYAKLPFARALFAWPAAPR